MGTLAAKWLFKSDPDTYSFANLERDGQTVWDGVSNNLALKHLRSVRRGDQALIYHTGDEKAVVGVMEAAADPVPDPDDETGKRVVVTVRPVRALKHRVPLAAIKAEKAFAGWELVRVPRLSVMPVSEALWKKIEAMSEKGLAATQRGATVEKVNPREIRPGVRWRGGRRNGPPV